MTVFFTFTVLQTNLSLISKSSLGIRANLVETWIAARIPWRVRGWQRRILTWGAPEAASLNYPPHPSPPPHRPHVFVNCACIFTYSWVPALVASEILGNNLDLIILKRKKFYYSVFTNNLYIPKSLKVFKNPTSPIIIFNLSKILTF